MIIWAFDRSSIFEAIFLEILVLIQIQSGHNRDIKGCSHGISVFPRVKIRQAIFDRGRVLCTTLYDSRPSHVFDLAQVEAVFGSPSPSVRGREK